MPLGLPVILDRSLYNIGRTPQKYAKSWPITSNKSSKSHHFAYPWLSPGGLLRNIFVGSCSLCYFGIKIQLSWAFRSLASTFGIQVILLMIEILHGPRLHIILPHFLGFWYIDSCAISIITSRKPARRRALRLPSLAWGRPWVWVG